MTPAQAASPATLAESLAALEPGARAAVELHVEGDLDVPVTLLRGDASRPLGAIVAGVHGDEIEGVAALGDVVRSLAPGHLAGSLIAVHAANPAGLRAGTRLHPDGGDLNRAFARDDATSTGRLAGVLAARLVRGLDALLTLHGWSRTGETVPYVEYPAGSTPVHAASRALARALGTPFVEAHEWQPGLLPAEGVRRGVPSAELEVGGLGRDTIEGRAAVARAISGFLAQTRIGRQPAGDGDEPAEVVRTVLAAPAPGVVRHLAPLGAAVRAGHACAEIRSVLGELEAELAPPHDGVAAIRYRFGWVERGAPVLAVFHPR